MTRIIFVRHAQSAPSPHLPQIDWPLTELGRAQAVSVANVLAEHRVEALASSPYVRAIDTLRPFAEARGLEIAIDEGLRERELGAWLETLAEVDEVHRRMHADPNYCRPGGESASRCLARFDAALSRVAAANPGRTVAVGSHGGILGHFLARFRSDLPDEFWRQIRNPHLFVFDFAGEPRWVSEHTLDGVAGLLG